MAAIFVYDFSPPVLFPFSAPLCYHLQSIKAIKNGAQKAIQIGRVGVIGSPWEGIDLVGCN